MVNFDALPKDKPNNNSVAKGTYEAVIFDAKMVESKTGNGEYMNVSFKTASGFVNENYFDSDKPFLQWKLGQLLKATNVTLKGEGTLKDIAKVVKGKKVMIDADVNDRGYACIDYSGEGVYSIDTVTQADVEAAAALDAELTEAIEADILDEDF